MKIIELFGSALEIISRWNNERQSWEAYVPDLPGNSFDSIDVGRFYWMSLKRSAAGLLVGTNGWIGTGVTIVVVDNNTVISPDVIKPAIAAVQKQVTEQFAPVWGIDAHVLYVPKGETVPTGAWTLYLQDEPDVGGVMGYHFDTNGMPSGKIFTKLNLSLNVPFSYILSHEVLEQLVDFDVNTFEFGTNNKFFIKEVCDPVAYSSFPQIDGQTVSSFVYPAWFRADGKAPYSSVFEDRITAPFTPAYYGSAYFTDGVNWNQVKGPGLGERLPASTRHSGLMGTTLGT